MGSSSAGESFKYVCPSLTAQSQHLCLVTPHYWHELLRFLWVSSKRGAPSQRLSSVRMSHSSPAAEQSSPAPVSTAVSAIAHMALFAAMVAVLGQVAAIPAGPVPITLQTLGVMLCGAVLGPWRGAGAMVLLNLLTLAGLPLMSHGTGGLAVYAGPTAGFVLGWIPGAFLVGLIVHSAWPLQWWRTILGTLGGGIAVIYACGIPVVAYQLGLTLSEAALANAIFIPGDLAKAAVAVIITHSLARAYPRAFTRTISRKRRQTPGLT